MSLLIFCLYSEDFMVIVVIWMPEVSDGVVEKALEG